MQVPVNAGWLAVAVPRIAPATSGRAVPGSSGVTGAVAPFWG